MSEYILGISAFYHDSAAALLKNGVVLAAAQEERFTRKKHDASFPAGAVEYVLDQAGITLDQVRSIAFYDKPYLKFERLLETYHAFAPKGLISFLAAMPVWIKEKLFMRRMIKKELENFEGNIPEMLFPEHHLSHAASAFYPSPFTDAAVLTMDGVGEWDTTTICHGQGKDITKLRQVEFPHSLGLLYSAFTYYCGFRVNSGEYKLMGLAPYGIKNSAQVKMFKRAITENLIDIRDDGSFVLNMDYFNYASGLTMCRDKKWAQLFHLQRREPESEIEQGHINLALAIQEVTEDIALKLAKTARELTGSKNLVLAGGVGLNCVANGKILRSGIFEDIWIQPAAGDAGGALGAAMAAWHIYHGRERRTPDGRDMMQGAYLGPAYTDQEIETALSKYQAKAEKIEGEALFSQVAGYIAQGKVVGWFQGRMEFGPRALGARSILGDPRNRDMQKKINLKIKFREGFRPFAPSVLEEDIQDWFDLDRPSPYMLLVAPVAKKRLETMPDGYQSMPMYQRLYQRRSEIPAVTHVDFSARVQSVNKSANPRYWHLINSFKKITGCPVLVNTSFNVRGEPIVRTPEEAYLCFMRTRMDILVLGNHVLFKHDQPEIKELKPVTDEFGLD